MTQSILSSLDSDEVNSISDTTEARQVAECIKTAYFDIASRANLPEQTTIFGLDPSNDVTMPTLMYIPSNVSKIEWIKYDTNLDGITSEPEYNWVSIYPIDQFIDMNNRLNTSNYYVDKYTIEDKTFYYNNDRSPTYCTILKDKYVIFDSYVDTVDNTLQASKILAFGRINPSFNMTDSFVPELDDNQFPLLLNEAKSLAFFELKQTPHEKAEQSSRRHWRSLQHSKYVSKPNPLNSFADFGRK